MQLEAAVAALGAEYVAGQALGVHPHQDVRLPADVPVHQRHVLRPIHVVAVPDDGELAELGRDPGLGHPVDQLLGPQPVGHQLGHGDEGQPVLLGDLLELGPARHGAVGIQDLADHAGRVEPGQAGEIDAGLGLPDPLKHAAGAGAERERRAPDGEDRRGPWPG